MVEKFILLTGCVGICKDGKLLIHTLPSARFQRGEVSS